MESEGVEQGRRALLGAWTWLVGRRGTGPEERPGTEREVMPSGARTLLGCFFCGFWG